MLDTSVLIAIVDANDAYHEAAQAAIVAGRASGDSFVLPVAAYAEFMVQPYRDGQVMIDRGDAFIDAIPARIEPVTREIGRTAASIRARDGRRVPLPDALIVATAVVLGADRILTADTGWPPQDVAVHVLAVG